MTSHAVEMNNVTFGYNKNKILYHGLTMNIESGKCYCLLGHNGAGKTTLIRLCLGLLAPQSGNIKISRNAKISYIPDHGGVFDYLTVYQNIKIFSELNHFENSNYERLMQKWKLTALSDQTAASLSMGQRQRLSIALSDAEHSNTIFMDEPTSNIDIKTHCLLATHINDLKKQKTTIICATHDIELIKEIADVIIVLDSGKIVYQSDMVNIDDLPALYAKYTENNDE
jgi:ABC-type multidrug transport system ATPase subunit